MYPIGIRVVKVSGKNVANIGQTGTVVRPVKKVHPDCDMAVQFDLPGFNQFGYARPAGTIWSAKSSQWRPINPDADDETLVKDKELEEVL